MGVFVYLNLSKKKIKQIVKTYIVIFENSKQHNVHIEFLVTRCVIMVCVTSHLKYRSNQRIREFVSVKLANQNQSLV